jgi:hypothetical protein
MHPNVGKFNIFRKQINHVQAGTSIYKVARWLGDDVEVVQRHYGHLADFDYEVNRAFATTP